MAIKSTITVGNKKILELDANPMVSSTVAPIGAMGIWDNAGLGRWFVKIGSGGTAWAEVDFFPAFQCSWFKADGATIPTQYTENIASFDGVYTTDSNSDITIYATNNGLAGGTALFSAIFSPEGKTLYTGGTYRDAGHVFVKSISADLKKIVMGIVKGQQQGILIGGTINTLIPVGSGVKVYISFKGIKA